MPRISLLMPAYNAAKYLSRAIESAIAQSFTDWELIIVDDCSTDSTRSIAESYAAGDARIKVLSTEKNSGTSYLPRLIAAKAATGDFLSQLDADDCISPDCLATLMECQSATGATIVYPELHVLDGEKRLPVPDFDVAASYPGRNLVKLTLNGWKVPCAGGIIERNFYLANIYPDANHKHIYIDEVETRMMLYKAEKVAFCSGRYYYRDNPDSITRLGSLKQVTALESDLALQDFICSHFPKDSEEYSLMMQQRYANIVACMHYVASHNFRTRQTRDAWRKIKAASASLDFRCLSGKMPWLMFAFMRLGFPFARAALRTKHYLLRRYKP